ncbi:flagellar hook-length control protein FliK [Caballeronia sp. SEWSISQ10-4 2]|uniref:flagellar hook-length control protein FliK n=1 Tax=Caballeronia sp. SEWSISQ10-4 2 TaxID=2937438 RepID=UPI00264C46FD|nr:flagellar hook-length control protein FliK [Caballeronia sp. SEWSISQ10-4 2]MDN7182017.1 flagellar hook-length control protein FliK [Caballeronia sp. SEWSISQ10-4 2]
MPGLDSAIAALLASRTDMLLSALNTQTSSTAPQANTSQLSVDTPRVAAPASAINAYAAPGPSTQTALSEIARTLDAISRFGGSATPALLGNMPLWPTAPRIVQAASAFESLSGSLFSSSSASAAGAVNPPATPLPATVLAGMLARTVADSGLFYENHIAQWLGGQRSLASLSNEPQARTDRSASGLPSGSFAQPAAAAAEVWIDETLLPPTFAADNPNPMNSARPVPTPQTPQQAAALAASVREMPASVFSSSAPASSGASTGTQSSAAHVQDSAVQAALASGIHPSTIPLVRQQLDVLASDQFRWAGEAWPGAKFEWQIQPQNHGPQERDAYQDQNGGAIDADRAWHTRVTLTLPTLGNVDADLVLTGNQLVVRMNASEGGAARLAADGDHFRQQIDAAGLQLAGLTVRARDSLAESAAGPALPHFTDVASAAGLPASTSTPPGRSST